MFEGLKERLGLGEKIVIYSEKQKMVKLILIVLIPFYIVWGLFNFLFFFGFPMEWSVIVLVCGFFSWGTFIVMIMNQRQMEAGQYECFRQLKWRMSVTQRIAGDIYVDKNIEYIGHLWGYQIYKPHFPFALKFMHPTFNGGDGVVFDNAFWLLPDKWEETFYHVPQQEAWYGSLPVAVRAEDVTLHNLGWGIREGRYIPIALVVDSNRHYEATIGRVDIKESQKQPEIAKYVCQIAHLTSQGVDLAVELAQEVQHNKGLLKATDNLVRLKREQVEDIKKRHGDIKRIPSDWRTKINWRLVILGIAVLGGIGALWYFLINL